MHRIKLEITGPNTESEEFFELSESYFDSLFRSKQIVNEEYQYEKIYNGFSVNLYCPEKDSYIEKNSTVYTNKWRNKLEAELSCNFQFNYIGLDPNPESEIVKVPENLEFLILHRYSIVSPLIEGNTLEGLPLYKVPYTYHDKASYHEINSWEYNYKRVLGLWYGSSVGERWAQNQLQNHDSELSIQGIKCCKNIEEVLGVPTYYFLFNYRAWGSKKDLQRKCPNCKCEWYIEGKTDRDVFAFKCDKCRLVSELSSNS